MTNVRSVIAEYEREKILERTARGRVGRVKAGFVPGGGGPWGIPVKHPQKGAYYKVHPEESALVLRIFQLYVAGQRSQEAIAAQLTQEGIPTPGDLRPGLGRTLSTWVWHRSTVLVNELLDHGRPPAGSAEPGLDWPLCNVCGRPLNACCATLP
jgi:DNA invertase Pin-like site-specific DNA recombinase